MKLSVSLIIVSLVSSAVAFLPNGRPAFCSSKLASSMASSAVFVDDDEEEIVPIAEHYLRAKYRAVRQSHGHTICDKEDAKEILRSVLPPVTPEELDDEVSKTLSLFPGDNIAEDDFVSALMGNTY
jgi:hypothetical protein